jgi:hypothetical protein
VRLSPKTYSHFGSGGGLSFGWFFALFSFFIFAPPSFFMFQVCWERVLKNNKKTSKGYKSPSEAFISASSGNPLSWLSPRKLRFKVPDFLG